VDLRVEASAPVEVYIVQESDLDNWKAGDSYEGWSFPTAKATCAQLIFPRRRAAGNEIQAEAENAEDSNGWAATRRRSGCNSESEGEIVPTTTLNPGKFRKFLYETTTKRRKVDLRVEASAPVEVYIVQESDLDNWKAGDSYEGWSFPTAKATRAQLIFPAAFEKDWYLVLRNPGDKVAGVHYELFDV
jgi:hypothetical protein